MFASATDADSTAHIGFPTQLAGNCHIVFAQRLQRRQHAVGATGIDAIERSGLTQGQERIGDTALHACTTILGRSDDL